MTTEPSFHIDDIRFRLAAARRILHRGGCDSGVAGHVSARAEGEQAFWTSPMAYFDEALPTHAIKMGFDLSVIEGQMAIPGAMAFHSAIYKARPEVNGIVHVHSRYVNVLTAAERTVGMYNISSLIFHDEQALYVDSGDSPLREVGRIVTALSQKRVVLMRHHGAIVVSSSLENATVDTLLLEEAARCHLEAQALGGSEIVDEKLIRTRRENPYLRKLHWEANLRRLERSDPDLYALLQR